LKDIGVAIDIWKFQERLVQGLTTIVMPLEALLKVSDGIL
jgi:hypothetical protein